jgi:hypothetical protein
MLFPNLRCFLLRNLNYKIGGLTIAHTGKKTDEANIGK